MGVGAQCEAGIGELASAYRRAHECGRISANAFLSVNVSSQTARLLPDLDWFHRLPLRRVVIEMSEQATIEDYGAFRRVLDGLRAKGLKVAVDDVGAGLASLKHLVMLPHDILKLDLDVVRRVDTNNNCQAMVAALVTLAQARRTQLVAEGVETSDELVPSSTLESNTGRATTSPIPDHSPKPPS